MAAPLTETAIDRLRELIASGTLRPGDRLPPEAELATQLGASRNTVREAVRALVTARVLDVRRGDGTFVTSLRPELLLDGIAFAAEMLQADYSLELIAVRRILEGAATGLAARNIDDGRHRCAHGLPRTGCAPPRRTRCMVKYDEQFHALVASASGNATLASMLAGVSSQTIRARVWRGNLDRGWWRGRSPSTRTSWPLSSPETRSWRRRRRPSTWPRPRPGSRRPWPLEAGPITPHGPTKREWDGSRRPARSPAPRACCSSTR